MAKQSVSQQQVVPTGGVVVDATLHQVSALDAIHQATCMLEHLAEIVGADSKGVETNASFGQHLLLSQIAAQLRVAVNQMMAEQRQELGEAVAEFAEEE